MHESMEALRGEANKLIGEANEREQKATAELERLDYTQSFLQSRELG